MPLLDLWILESVFLIERINIDYPFSSFKFVDKEKNIEFDDHMYLKSCWMLKFYGVCFFYLILNINLIFKILGYLFL